jgi:hypothetical protein
MNISFLAPARTVLLIADEALCIYSTGPKGVRLVETIPWDAQNFEDNVAGVIAKDCGRKPVLILNDMVEQHYRKERVIRTGVGMLDKANMLRRKLNVAFPNYPVKAAFMLKEKAPKTDKKTSDIYIFAAIPGSPQFMKSLAATKKSLASITGLYLLPVESSDMVKALAAKLPKKNKAKSRWTIFVGQHRNGSLRQIVTKNGELALTRMTPIIDSDSNSEIWAGEVYQEFKATMSYLSRFGYQSEDGLDVIVIANHQGGEALERLVEEDCNFATMTVNEAARMVGVPLGRQDEPRYADALHVAWAGRKSKFVLPMRAPQIEQVSKPRQMAMTASALMLCTAAFFGYQLLDGLQAMSGLNQEIDDGRNRQAQLEVQFQKEVKRKEDLGFDVRLVQSSIAVYETLEKERIKPLALFRGVGNALGKDLRIDKISVTRKEKEIIDSFMQQAVEMAQATPQEEKKSPLYEASMQMTYPSTTDIDRGNQEVRDLQQRLKAALPGDDVTVTKFLKDYEYSEGIVVESGDLAREDVKQDFVAEIMIKGGAQ